jgi:hypothetical protein
MGRVERWRCRKEERRWNYIDTGNGMDIMTV